MPDNAWLLRRAVLAITLMVSFYALALGIAGFLLWIPYEAYVYEVRLPAKLVLVCIGCAALIVWAILPRIDRFVAPGPRLTSADAPELFSSLEQVAAATGQSMPADVYLVNDVNAFVTQRGGVMGFGSKRVMGIGLPLMQSLNVQEFKAVLAHEFGHYHSGDVAIGPWIYKTRAAIGRTIQQLGEGWLGQIFIAYGNLFLRVTHAISRRQEFIADEVAARAAGAGAMASALRKVHGAAMAFGNYWRSEVGPILNSGYLPPVTAGFARFTANEAVTARMAESVRHAEAEEQGDPFDTHPPLRERVAALQSLPAGADGDTRPAVSLLGDPQRWERRLLGTSINEEWARSLTPVAWDQIVETVYVPQWRALAKENRRVLQDISLTSPVFAGHFAPGGMFREEDQTVLHQIHVTNVALSLALLEAGWTASTSPGEQIVFRRDGHEFRPFGELMDVGAGRTSVEAWAARCRELGIAGMVLREGVS